MEGLIIQHVITGAIGGIAAGIAAVSTIRAELRWLRRDVDRIERRVDGLLNLIGQRKDDQ